MISVDCGLEGGRGGFERRVAIRGGGRVAVQAWDSDWRHAGGCEEVG